MRTVGVVGILLCLVTAGLTLPASAHATRDVIAGFSSDPGVGPAGDGSGPAPFPPSSAGCTSGTPIDCAGAPSAPALPSSTIPNWANLSGSTATAPPSSDGQFSVAYDVRENCTVLFEAQWSQGAASTWRYCGGVWQDLTPNLSVSPPVDSELGMAYDAHDGYVVMFGGGPYGIHDGTWRFENDTWSNISATAGNPPGRALPSFAYDAADGYLLMFGGWSGSTTLGDTWTFQGGTWTQLPFAPGAAPSARFGAGLAFDRQDNATYLFGGADAASNPLHDTWKFSNGNWTRLAASGLPSYVGVPVESPDGGIWTFSYSGTTAQYSSGAWSQFAWTAPPSPPISYSFGLAYDSGTATVLLVGASYLESTWGARAETWALPGPVLASASLRPASLEVGSPTNLSIAASGGRGNYTYALSGLPTGPGCAAPNSPQLTCTPDQSGTYAIEVTVTDQVGNSTSTSVILHVLPGPAVTGSVTPGLVDAGVTPLTFAVAVANGTPPFSYTWTGLPMGCIAGPPPIDCRAVDPGSFTAAVTVQDGTGQLGEFTYPTVVVVPPVVAAVTTTPLTGSGPLEVTLAAVARLGVAPYSFDWTFGDGGTSVSPALNHVFAAPGDFSLALTVRDSAGASFSWNGSARVLSPLVFQPAVSPSVGEVGWPVLLESGSSGGPAEATFTWTGLPSPCLTANVTGLSCVPDAPGNFTVNVSATVAGWVVAAASIPFTVEPQLHVALRLGSPPSGCGVFNASLIASPIGGVAPDVYVWAFGDGGSATTGPSVTHVFGPSASSGEYTAQVTVTDALGATAIGSGTFGTLTPCSSAGSGSGGVSPIWGGLAVGVILGAAAAATILLRTRPRGPGPRVADGPPGHDPTP